MSSRPRRSAAIKALEKIQKIVKEEEKYDDYGDEIEEEFAYITSILSEPINVIPEEPVKTIPEKSTATPSVSEKKEPAKTTPNTLFAISSSHDNLQYNAYELYLNHFKTKHIELIKKYLNLCGDSNMKYIAIPELIKYLITNPALLIHSSLFGEVVVKKMIEFENELPIANKIGSYIITDDYRKQLLSLIKILKKTSIMYSKLKTMVNKEFYDNIETIVNEF
jgi:hypothetical protein